MEWYGSPKVIPKECEIVEVSEYGRELGFKKGNFIFKGVLLPTDLDQYYGFGLVNAYNAIS